MGHKTRKAILYTTAVLVPPLAIYFQHGTHRKHFGLSILLTLLGWYVVAVPSLYPFLLFGTHPIDPSREPEPASRQETDGLMISV
jgi:uncharacterized membrane protein YqaE (UPF0057 family)